MFTNMFGGDGKTPEDDDGRSPRDSKATNEKGGIFTPVAGLIDGVRRSLTRSDAKDAKE
jgi:hypothetical protein